MAQYTVIGFYPDQNDAEREREGLDYFVEFVEAADVQGAWDAVVRLRAEDPILEQSVSYWPVAILEGHHEDKMFDGLVVAGDCDASLGIHGCVLSPGHAGPHSCDSECDLGHLREDEPV